MRLLEALVGNCCTEQRCGEVSNNRDCTGAHVRSDCENLFGSWQGTPKSVTAVQIGMGG